ncbi:MAG TPA: hypothetical protein VJ044_20180, partial [Candidatus Hodarchaeales archaeon]|nr:hypothetical protein [Candidatus Hodarchaeales archaeon]
STGLIVGVKDVTAWSLLRMRFVRGRLGLFATPIIGPHFPYKRLEHPDDLADVIVGIVRSIDGQLHVLVTARQVY